MKRYGIRRSECHRDKKKETASRQQTSREKGFDTWCNSNGIYDPDGSDWNNFNDWIDSKQQF